MNSIRKLVAVLLLCNPGFAAVCTSAGTGNWDVITWSCGHPPTTADSTVIATGNTVTVESGLTTAKTTGITFSGTNPTLVVASGGVLNAGTLVENGATVLTHIASGGTANLGTNTAVSLTTDVTITLGTFTADPGSNLNLTGTLKSGPTGTANVGGHVVVTPNGPGVHQDLVCNSSSTGSAQLNIVGSSPTSRAVVETVALQSAGGNTIVGTTAGSPVCDLNIQNAIFNNVGDTTNNSITWSTQTNPGSLTIDHLMLMHSGKIVTTTNSGVGNPSTFRINALDFRNTNAAGNILWALGSTNTTVPSAPRNITNVTCDVENFAGSLQSITVAGSNFNFGSSTLPPSNGSTDVSGLNSFNCILNMTGINNTEQNWLFTYDYTGAGDPGNTLLTMNYASNNIWNDNVIYYHGNNTHINFGTISAGVGNNIFSYTFYDGDQWNPGDAGSLCMMQGNSTCNNNIGVNGNGNISNVIGQPSSLVMDNNLLWNQSGSSEGESVSNALQYTEYYDNLFPCPTCLVDGTTWPPGGNCNAYMCGANQESLWLTQSLFDEDYNWKYNFPNEGDPKSITCTNTNNAIVFPFLGIFGYPNQDFRGSPALNAFTSTGLTGTNCPGLTCEVDYLTGGFTTGGGDLVVQPNDTIFNNTKATWTTINTVSNNNKVLINSGTVGNMTAVTSGDKFSIGKGVWADHTAIGGGNNRGLHDVHMDPVLFNPGVGVCTWFDTIGGSQSCPTTIAASGRTDANILFIGHMAMTINGYDYGSASSLAGTNCSASCPAPVTPWAHTATEILKYAAQQYRVYNGAAKNAGHAGGDVGPAWIPNYPSAILSF